MGVSRKGVMLRHILLLTINMKPCIGSRMALSHFTWVTLKGQSQSHQDFQWEEISMIYVYLSEVYDYHLNLVATWCSLLAAGFSAVPAVFLVLQFYYMCIFEKWKDTLKIVDACTGT